jgi:hypothetical protein
VATTESIDPLYMDAMSTQASHRVAPGRSESMRALHSLIAPIVPVKDDELQPLLYSFGTLYSVSSCVVSSMLSSAVAAMGDIGL